jgi:hypothetical protein
MASDIDDFSKRKAKEVCEYLKKSEDVPESETLDPALLAAIAALIIQLILVFEGKRKTVKETLAIIKNPGIMQRWDLRSRVNSHFGDSYKDIRYKIMNGLYYVAKNITDLEFSLVYKEPIHDD